MLVLLREVVYLSHTQALQAWQRFMEMKKLLFPPESLSEATWAGWLTCQKLKVEKESIHNPRLLAKLSKHTPA